MDTDHDKKQLTFDLDSTSVSEAAFDEMNLIEIPFCTLRPQKTTDTRISLTPDGHEYLVVNDQRYGLPTALAEPTILGLMWLTMRHNNFKERIVKFQLRELVEKHMYPHRFTKYRADGKLIASVEQELHRVAATRIHSDRWYDKIKGEKVAIDASIIDYIKTYTENNKKYIELAWGSMVYESIQSRYTKNLDLETYLQIRNPLARRFYRWIDRQLHQKPTQHVKSCQRFARYKLLMTGKNIDRGGRTASNYIVKKLSEVLVQFDELSYPVRMTIDRSNPDFSLTFERLWKHAIGNEVVTTDQPGELVRDYLHFAHGVTRERLKKRRLQEGDRDQAGQWLADYGYEQSKWMIPHCVTMHKRRTTDLIYNFKGLNLYLNAAIADYERWKQQQAGQLELTVDEDYTLETQKEENIEALNQARLLIEQMDHEERIELHERAKDSLPSPLNEMESTIENQMCTLILTADK